MVCCGEPPAATWAPTSGRKTLTTTHAYSLFVRRLRTIRQPFLEDLQYELRSNRSVRVNPHKFTGRTGSSYGFVAFSECGIGGNEGIQLCLQLTATCVRTRHRSHDSLACLCPRLQCTHTRLFLRQAPGAKYREHEATCHQDPHRLLPSPMSPLHTLMPRSGTLRVTCASAGPVRRAKSGRAPLRRQMNFLARHVERSTCQKSQYLDIRRHLRSLRFFPGREHGAARASRNFKIAIRRSCGPYHFKKPARRR